MGIIKNKSITIPVISLFIISIVAILLIFIINITPVQAAVDRYWVGDSGNWSDNTNHWSASSGGAPGASKPTSADNVYFDSNSFTAGSQTVTLDETAYCFDMDWTGVTNTPTIAGSNLLYIYGSLTFDSSMLCTTTGDITFAGTGGGDTVDFAGVSLSSRLIFNGVGGDWTLQDDITTTGDFKLINGTLDTNSQDLDTSNVDNDDAGTKILTLGSTTWNVSGYWKLSSASTTLNCGTSTIIGDTCSFTGGTKTYYDVQLTGNPCTMIDSCVFTNLTKTGAAIANDNFTVYADQTITGTFTLAGNSSSNRLRCKSNTTTDRVITAAATSVSNADFYYIEGSGAGNWDFSSNPNGCGWSGGCAGITFTSPIYWVGGSGNFFGGGDWTYTSGGVANSNFIPMEEIDTVFDTNSSSGDVNVYNGTYRYVKSITFTGTPGAIEFVNTTSGCVVNIYGNFITASNTTFNVNKLTQWTWRQDGNFNSNGANLGYSYLIPSSTSEITLAGDVYSNYSGARIGSSTGSIDTAGYEVDIDIMYISIDNTTLSTSDIYVDTLLTISGANLDAGTSTIYCNDFTGAGETFYDVYFPAADNSAEISGANTFHDLTIVGDNITTAQILFDADQTISNDLIITGFNASNYRILVASDTPGTRRSLNVYHGYALQYCNVRDIIAGGDTSPWDCTAGINVDLGNNLYITFTPSENIYWVGNAGNWSEFSHWSSSSGGSGGTARVPIGNDTAIFNAYSITLPGQTITMDIPNVPSLNTTAVENNPTFSATTLYFSGDLLLGDCTFSVTTVYFELFENQTLASVNDLTSALIIDKDPTSMPYLVLGSDITVSNTITLLAGTLKLDAYTFTATNFVSTVTTDTRAIDMDTGTFILTGTGTKWSVSATNLTITDSPDSTIVFDSDLATACTFAGASFDYGNFTIMGAGVYSTTISGTNSFNIITIDRSEANKTITGSVTCTILGLSIPLSGTNTVTITNTDFSMASGAVYGDYLIISGSAASGGATFWASAGGHSTNNGGNSGWLWTIPNPPTVVTLDPSDVSYMGERLNGEITDMGDYSYVYCYFEYGPTTSYGWETSPMDTLTGIDTFDFYLSPYKVYHYRSVVYFGLGVYDYGSDKTVSLSGAVGQATADLTDLDFTEGTPLVDDAPVEPGQMYDEGSTNGIPFADFINEALAKADVPQAAFWYPVAFFIAILIGFLVYGWTRSFVMQPISSGLVMAAFCGGGALGDGLLPFFTVLIFAIEAVMVFLIQERQTA